MQCYYNPVAYYSSSPYYGGYPEQQAFSPPYYHGVRHKLRVVWASQIQIEWMGWDIRPQGLTYYPA